MTMKIGNRIKHTQGVEVIFVGKAPTSIVREDGTSTVYNLKTGSTDLWANGDFSAIEPETPLTCVYVVNTAKVGVWRIAGGVLLANLLAGIIAGAFYAMFR